MNIKHIGSGSHGNAFIVERTTDTIQIDCGLKAPKPDHLLITHEHKDHSKYFNELVMAKVKWWAPMFVAQRLTKDMILADDAWELYERPDGIDFFKVDHDVPTCGYVVQDGEESYCHVTDGSPMEIKDSMKNCTFYAIESNYDEMYLEMSDIHPYLKDRIQQTHMSNKQALTLAHNLAGERTQWVNMIHMSGDRNSVEIAKMEHVESKLKLRYGGRE